MCCFVVICPKLLWDNKLIEVSTGTPQTARNTAKKYPTNELFMCLFFLKNKKYIELWMEVTVSVVFYLKIVALKTSFLPL